MFHVPARLRLECLKSRFLIMMGWWDTLPIVLVIQAEEHEYRKISCDKKSALARINAITFNACSQLICITYLSSRPKRLCDVILLILQLWMCMCRSLFTNVPNSRKWTLNSKRIELMPWCDSSQHESSNDCGAMIVGISRPLKHYSSTDCTLDEHWTQRAVSQLVVCRTLKGKQHVSNFTIKFQKLFSHTTGSAHAPWWGTFVHQTPYQ